MDVVVLVGGEGGGGGGGGGSGGGGGGGGSGGGGTCGSCEWRWLNNFFFCFSFSWHLRSAETSVFYRNSFFEKQLSGI
jgi:hypothetical protein